jgi:hypothetical protein
MTTTPRSDSSDLVLVGGNSPTERRVAELVQEFATAWQRTKDMAVDLGQALIDHKATLGHGEWLPWLETGVFPLGQDMAENFMRLARNSEEIRKLPPGTPVTAAVKYVKLLERNRRPPKPVPPAVPLEVDAAPVGPLLRFMYEVPSATIVTLILRILFPDARTALDPCYGEGNFWDGTAHVTVTAHDKEESRAPDGVMLVEDLDYEDASIDVVLFDPPHLADGGEDSEMANRFGTVKDQDALEKLIEDGTRECWRVCSKGIVVKVADHNHGEVFNDMSLLVCDAVGHWPYDKVYQVRSHAFIDPSWGPQMTAYNNGAVYLIFRKGEQRHVQRG